MRFILFDKILSCEKGVGGVGVKNVTIGEDFFRNHFDRSAVMPESLLIESVAQVGGWLVAVSCDHKYSAILTKVGSARFYRSVRPGDQLHIDVRIGHFNDYASTIDADVTVEGAAVAEVSKLMYVLNENDKEFRQEMIASNVFNSGGFLDSSGNCKGG